jgi:hypothetical protein
LLIRAERSRNRKVIDDSHSCELLWTTLEQQAVIGTRALLVPPSEQRAARQATLAVRTAAVTLRPPQRKKHLPSVRVWAVLAREIDPPAPVDALEWMLLTTCAVRHREDAYERLEWYARRWGIEVYHRILKSGCRVEARQLEQARRLQNCLAIDMVVAWRIHYLTTLGRETPDVPCTVYFTASEWKALTTFTSHTKTPPATPRASMRQCDCSASSAATWAARTMASQAARSCGAAWRVWRISRWPTTSTTEPKPPRGSRCNLPSLPCAPQTCG